MATKIGFIFEVQGGEKSVRDLVATESALQGIRDTSRQIKRELKEVEKALKATGKSKAEIDALKKKHAQLSETLVKLKGNQIEVSEESKKFRKEIREQVREFDRAKYPTDSLEGLSDQYSKLRKEIRQLSKDERNSPFGKQLIKDAKKIKDEVRSVSESFGDTSGSVGTYQIAIENALRGNGTFSSNFRLLGKNLIKVALPLAAIVKGVQLVGQAISSAVNITLKYQQANADLASILGKSRDQIKGLQKVQQQYGATTAFSATQTAKLQTELAKLGFTSAEIVDSTQGVINFAIATGADVPRAAALAGSALRAFNLDAAEMDRVVSVLGVATTKSALDFGFLEIALSKVAPVARTFGFSVEDTAALLGTLADAGFDASTAGTATKNILLNLADTSGDLAKELGGAVTSFDEFIPALIKLRDGGVDLNKTLELTDRRSVTAFQQFLQTAEGAVTLRDGITDVNEELQIMADERMNTVEGSITLLKSAWEGLVLSIEDGEGPISGAFKSVIDFTADFLTSLRQINEGRINGIGQFSRQYTKDLVEADKVIVGMEKNLRNVLKTQKAIDAFVEEKDGIALLVKVYQDAGFELGAAQGKALDLIATLEGAAEEEKKFAKATAGGTDALKEQGITIEALEKRREDLLDKRKTAVIDSDEYKNLTSEIQKLDTTLESAGLSKKLKNVTEAFADGSLEDLQKELAELNEDLKGNNDDSLIEGKLENIIAKEKEIENLKRKMEELRNELERGDLEVLPEEIADVSTPLPSIELDQTKIQYDEQKKFEDDFQSYKNKSFADSAKFRKKQQEENEKEELERRKELEDKIAEIKSQAFRVVGDLSNAIFSIQRNRIDEETEAELDAVNTQYASKIEAAEGNKEEQKKLEEELQQKRDQIETKAAKKRQGVAVKEAIIQGALAAVEALPNLFAVAAAVAATAAQIAIIKSQNFAGGGFTGSGNGSHRTDETGQVPVGVVHANEYVADRFDTKEFRPFFEWLESRKGRGAGSSSFKYAGGGFSPSNGEFIPQVIKVTEFVQTVITLEDEQIEKLVMAITAANADLPKEVGSAAKGAMLEGQGEANRLQERKKFSEAKNTY